MHEKSLKNFSWGICWMCPYHSNKTKINSVRLPAILTPEILKASQKKKEG